MARIRLLDPQTISRIAAGEVIERPASVVKELLDNSIDAGATRIEIEVEAGGIDLIRVVDDGCGMEADDLPLAFSTHATSKLVTVEDLLTIQTLGFRGEALASIGGVSQVVLRSRRHEKPAGAEIRCDGGELSELRPWNGRGGTCIEVRHLFFSVPVRKKFLKSVAAELSQISEVVTRQALAHQHMHLVLKHNGKLVYEVPGSSTLHERIGLFFGHDVHEALYEIDSGPGPIRLTGYIADPKCDRGTAKLQYLFVNGRHIRDRSLSHALQESYRGLLMTGRYAVGSLFLDLPSEFVDVNVHPTKSEVRFRDNSQMYSLVRSTVKSRLLKEQCLPELTIPSSYPATQNSNLPVYSPTHRPAVVQTHFQPRTESIPLHNPSFSPNITSPALSAVSVNRPSPETDVYDLDSKQTRISNEDTRSVHDVSTQDIHTETSTGIDWAEIAPKSLPVGSVLQVHDAYLVVETADGMVVIDQHALHERILYEQFRQRIRDGKLEKQGLLIPEPIDLTAEQLAAVLEAKDSLAELGLEVTEFGGNTILLSSYPTLVKRQSPRNMLLAVVDYLTAKDRPPSKEAFMNDILATMACKAAVKAGDRLSPEEIQYLLKLRDMAEDSHHCPHGRPTSLVFSRKELDRQFRRI